MSRTCAYPRHTISARLWLGICLVANSHTSSAWQELTDAIDIRCEQQDFSKISCSYRALDGGVFHSIMASLDGDALLIMDEPDSAAKLALSAILFLVDTSDPRRQDVIDKNIEQIKELLAQGETQHIFGLATFDKQLQIKAAIGASNAQIAAASSALQARGMSTELYRNLLAAIALLDEVAADRKAIFIFSDGQAEDQAYFH